MKNRNKSFTLILIVFLFFFILIIVLTSPLFQISEIKIYGNNRVTDDYIKSTIGIDKPINIFALNVSSSKNKLIKSSYYVEDVIVSKDYLQRSVSINVKERILSGYVEYVVGTYLYIDENGRVLEVATSLSDKLPIVVGLDFKKEFTIGELLELKDKKTFDNLIRLSHLFNKYEMETDIIKVDLNNPDDTILFVDNIRISMGDISDADEKIRRLKVILEELKARNYKGGFLDIRDVNKNHIFRILR